ncbi:anti-sigma factor family protein [Amycolatopsis sacchari]|uniref:RNA polymerase sigma-70 factor, ECF subfamily n=1 Tax=Amycolatopsis sacchari TaxID=115433 RepID=A0A1I3W922_9PSEU|nr:zf-HC2 domain-containing protein [Amycolatopsis sacchari]SFK03900.1 RNA polymerase sigma-70 factor, ECF subfamily [Amycolatopsis sacchari]
MIPEHESRALGAYVLGALDLQEMRAMEQHLASCRRCQAELAELRMAHAALADLPPEALLDGPPEGGDLVLQRTLRRVREESGAQLRKRRTVVGVAAVAVAVALAGGGVALGRTTAPNGAAQAAAPAGTKTASATDAATGAKMSVSVQPAAGWVRLDASVAGIPRGQKCRLFVVSRDGTREEAGSWLVSEAGEHDGTKLSGAALVAPADVTAVEVENFAGQRYVTVGL